MIEDGLLFSTLRRNCKSLIEYVNKVYKNDPIDKKSENERGLPSDFHYMMMYRNRAYESIIKYAEHMVANRLVAIYYRPSAILQVEGLEGVKYTVGNNMDITIYRRPGSKSGDFDVMYIKSTGKDFTFEKRHFEARIGRHIEGKTIMKIGLAEVEGTTIKAFKSKDIVNFQLLPEEEEKMGYVARDVEGKQYLDSLPTYSYHQALDDMPATERMRWNPGLEHARRELTAKNKA
ncbi:MAG: hypothetical protein FWD15_02960 [Alphaproteobacteria bacterium]|nr:hypothetical protein [Alphaproteobacteria bacterium]